jgi:hypothetical protein
MTTMRMFLSVGALVLAVNPALAQQAAPAFPRNTGYAEARQSLVGLGWAPVTLPDADRCPPRDGRCAGRPEMLSCSGTGIAACAFTWRRGDTLIEVLTAGEVPVVTGTRCRAGCR